MSQPARAEESAQSVGSNSATYCSTSDPTERSAGEPRRTSRVAKALFRSRLKSERRSTGFCRSDQGLERRACFRLRETPQARLDMSSPATGFVARKSSPSWNRYGVAAGTRFDASGRLSASTSATSTWRQPAGGPQRGPSPKSTSSRISIRCTRSSPKLGSSGRPRVRANRSRKRARAPTSPRRLGGPGHHIRRGGGGDATKQRSRFSQRRALTLCMGTGLRAFQRQMQRDALRARGQLQKGAEQFGLSFNCHASTRGAPEINKEPASERLSAAPDGSPIRSRDDNSLGCFATH